MNTTDAIRNLYPKTTNNRIIKMSDILKELVSEKNGEEIIKKISNQIDNNTSFNDLIGLNKVKENEKKVKEGVSAGYAFSDWIKYFGKDLPKEISNSKFAKMDMGQLSLYAHESEEQRKELQSWVKLIYQWAFKNKKNELAKIAKSIKNDYDEKISKGMSEEEIYDFYFTHKNSTVFISTVWMLLFFGVFLVRVLYLLK